MPETIAPEKKIVIIDDDDFVINILTLILQEEYTVNKFYSAEEAISDRVLSEADVIITDVNLPGMDGIEFLEKVHDIDQNLPVIVITGFNDIDIAISALKSGAFDFILKPFKNDQILISVKKGYERRRLTLENIKLMEELKIKNHELEILNAKIQARNYAIENELDIASNLHQCLFPMGFPDIGDFQFDLRYKPVEKISGDFFDFIMIDEKRFSFFFGDVSGHGVPAALYSAMVKTAISSLSITALTPARFIKEMNNFLISSQKKMSYNYATIFYGYFDLERGIMRYCNGGIPQPAVIRATGSVEYLEPTGPFVGIFNTSKYQECEIRFEKGDKFIFYTDGAFECTDGNDNIMGHKQFLKFIEMYKEMSVPDIVKNLYSEVEGYSDTESFTDDITLLAMQYG